MDFGLSDDEALFQRSVREFADAVVAPAAASADQAGRFPPALLRETAALGLFGMLVPERFGGAGVDTLRYVLAIEAVARASAALAAVLNTHNALACWPLVEGASPAHRERWLPSLAGGEAVGAACGLPLGRHDAAQTAPIRATGSGAGVRLQGRAKWVVNAAQADIFVVVSHAEREAADGSTRAYAVPADTAGLAIGAPLDVLGLRGAMVAEVAFEACPVTADQALRAAAGPGVLAERAWDLARLGSAALALGVAGAALDAAIAYAEGRHQFGRAIVDFEGLRAMLADVHLGVETARLLVYRAAWLRDRDHSWGAAAALAKLHAAATATLAATTAVQVHGGYGYMQEAAVQRYYRDAKVIQAADEPPREQRAAVAAALLPGRG